MDTPKIFWLFIIDWIGNRFLNFEFMIWNKVNGKNNIIMLTNIKYQKLKIAKFSGAGIGTNVFKVGIKNIGENSVLELLEERKKNGKFTSLIDLLKRVNNKTLNKKVLEGLIFSGSLTSIEKNQNFLLSNIDKIISFNSSFHKNVSKDQGNLFTDFIDQKQFDSSNFKQCKFEEKLTME